MTMNTGNDRSVVLELRLSISDFKVSDISQLAVCVLSLWPWHGIFIRRPVVEYRPTVVCLVYGISV